MNHIRVEPNSESEKSWNINYLDRRSELNHIRAEPKIKEKATKKK